MQPGLAGEPALYRASPCRLCRALSRGWVYEATRDPRRTVQFEGTVLWISATASSWRRGERDSEYFCDYRIVPIPPSASLVLVDRVGRLVLMHAAVLEDHRAGLPRVSFGDFISHGLDLSRMRTMTSKHESPRGGDQCGDRHDTDGLSAVLCFNDCCLVLLDSREVNQPVPYCSYDSKPRGPIAALDTNPGPRSSSNICRCEAKNHDVASDHASSALRPSCTVDRVACRVSVGLGAWISSRIRGLSEAV